MNPQRTSLFALARRRHRAGFLVALGLLALALLPTVASGQLLLEPPPLGTHLFQNFLHGLAGLQPLKAMEDLNAKNPRESVLVIFGDLTCLDRLRPGLEEFVAAGGAVLIASDQPDLRRLAIFQLRISAHGAKVPSDVEDRENSKGPFVLLVPPGGDGIAPVGLQSKDRQDWVRKAPALKGYAFETVKDLQFGDLMPPGQTVTVTASRWKKQQAEPYPGLDQKFSDCILVKGHVGNGHPIFAHCTQGIVVDKPSYLLRRGNDLPEDKPGVSILCNFPPFPSRPESDDLRLPKRPYIISEPGFAAASGGNPDSQQRVVILSGHSLFLNCAIGQRDLDNATFTTNILRWLTDSKQRKYCLFVKDNQAVSKFDVPLLVPPMPTTRMINDFLRALEEENFFNRVVVDNIAKHKILRVLLSLALIGLAIYGARRYGLARHRQDYNVPLVQTKLARLVTDFIPPLARRRHHALRSRDFREAARVVARECFARTPKARLPAEPPVPAVSAADDRAALEYAVGRLWPLATGADAAPVSADAFSRIVELAEHVKAALARGTLRWQS